MAEYMFSSLLAGVRVLKNLTSAALLTAFELTTPVKRNADEAYPPRQEYSYRRRIKIKARCGVFTYEEAATRSTTLCPTATVFRVVWAKKTKEDTPVWPKQR